MWTVNFQMFMLDLEKAEEPEIKLPTSTGSSTKQESSKKHLLLLYWLIQSFWLCGSWNVENSERDGNTRPPDLPPEKSVCRSRRNMRTGHGTTDWFQISKRECQGCILSPYLFKLYSEYIMEKLGWMKHEVESRFPGEISVTSDMQMTPP